MGAAQSNEHGASSPEELSLVLAERFATKCFTPLELTHFKDNFYSRALEQGGLRYWNEEVLSDFLGIPDGIYVASQKQPLDVGPVIFRMVSYLGAFPFQNTLAPSVLTFEAMVKVVVLLTERYSKALKRGHKDRIKLLFGSLADVGRKTPAEPYGKSTTEDSEASVERSYALGFSIDEPANDEYEEDEDDDLALAALESLDAIEVFKHDHRVDRTVYETRISIDTFRRLLMLLLVIAPLKPLESMKVYTSGLDGRRMELVKKEADCIIAAFSPEESDDGISYKAFARTISLSLPYLFDPLTALFEHMLFSKNLNLSQHRHKDQATETEQEENEELPSPSATLTLPGSFKSAILDSTLTSHLSFFLPSTSTDINVLRSSVKLHPVFSTSAHGSSLTSFSHHVLTWQTATLLLLQGSLADSNGEELITLGAYIPQMWRTSTSASSSSSKNSDILPCLFQLYPKHLLLPGNPSLSAKKPNTPIAYFSPNTGIAIGCRIPAPSRTHQTYPTPHGAGSLIIDANIEIAEFHAASFGHDGVFLPAANTSLEDPPTNIKLDLHTLEIWGIIPDPESSFSADPRLSPVEIQRAKWEFEAREAERRRNINLKAGAGDSARESARWLLEAAGIIGDEARYSGERG
ncbi:Restriction of telomere capping protein 5 [Penicillium digitatum]|uniref:Restriction of telomere capping protein 5 n=1 Tax=Penicillium digitatum TaxID=36651 RepID=A0A7T6XEU0_PENDI|nr:Restriction of telomere capping protein 5 [Penicillium digitatum]